jgi:uncharacterized protein YcfJ
MKKTILALSVTSLFGSAYASDFTDTARVISATPIYETVSEPKRECWTETVQVAPKERSIGGAVVGGIAGGLLGSQVGGGTGNKAATAAGGIAGAIIGDRVANPDQPRTEQVERCREVQASREVIKGYTVVYRYNGQDVTTTLPYRPGSTLRVGVSVIDDGRRGSDEPAYRRSERKDDNYRRDERRDDEPSYRRTRESDGSYYR